MYCIGLLNLYISGSHCLYGGEEKKLVKRVRWHGQPEKDLRPNGYFQIVILKFLKLFKARNNYAFLIDHSSDSFSGSSLTRFSIISWWLHSVWWLKYHLHDNHPITISFSLMTSSLLPTFFISVDGNYILPVDRIGYIGGIPDSFFLFLTNAKMNLIIYTTNHTVWTLVCNFKCTDLVQATVNSHLDQTINSHQLLCPKRCLVPILHFYLLCTHFILNTTAKVMLLK